MKQTVEVDAARLRVMLAVAALEGRETGDPCMEVAEMLLESERERDARLLTGGSNDHRPGR